MTYRFNNIGLFVEVIDAKTDKVIMLADASTVSANTVISKDVTNYRYLANKLGITIKEAIKLYGHI